MKRFIIYAAIVVLAFSLIYQPELTTMGRQMTAGQVVREVAASSEAELEEVTVQSWHVINDRFLPTKELRQMAEELTSDELLGQVTDWQVQVGESPEQHQVEFTGTADDYNISVLFQSIANLNSESEDAGQTYLLVTVTSSNEIVDNSEKMWNLDIVSIEYIATNIFHHYDIYPGLAINYIGKLNKSLTGQEKEALVEEMFSTVNGKNKEGLAEEFIVSYSGYTPEIADSIWTGKSDVNLQIAVRDHSDGENTMVYVGYPLLISGY